MSRALATDSLSLTGGGAAAVTDAAGSVDPNEVAGVFVDDVRVVALWRLEAGAAVQRVGHVRLGPNSDRLVSTLCVDGSVDPVAVFERTRTVAAGRFGEELAITAFAGALDLTLRLSAARDDCSIFAVGTVGGPEVSTIVAGEDGAFSLPGPPNGASVEVVAPGWRLDDGALLLDVAVGIGDTWGSTVAVTVAREGTDTGVDTDSSEHGPRIDTTPPGLGHVVATGRSDLRALTIDVDGRRLFAAGSPFFLALFGRDSLIAGMQALMDTPQRLTDTLAVLAARQATASDPATRAEPGRILHELRLGRADVFGVPARTPYFGAVDTAALFVVALGEAWRWGATADTVGGLLPAARAALEWCRRFGDVDGDGFVESVPHPSGLVNQGWKDSGDAIVDPAGVTRVEAVALPEVQAYWYRAARTLGDVERRLGVGDGAEADAEAERLAAAFGPAFVFDDGAGPFVGLGLDAGKRLLTVRASNAGHVLWSGVLPPGIADAVAEQLTADDLFSGWGVRTLSAAAAGYNPFGYHRGSVWPHDTALALLGAARYGAADVVRRLSDGLVALGAVRGGELPELVSGLGRADVALPVPYAAACRPQAWAAGTSLMAVRALLGFEPDLPNGLVRIHPMLHDGHSITIRGLRCGEHQVTLTATGNELTDFDAPGLDVVTGPAAVLAATDWCPPPPR
jgi:hypothetical protein